MGEVQEAQDLDEIDEEIVCKLYPSSLGKTVTLPMLLNSGILKPGKYLSIEYLGQKFIGDLLPDGKIKSQETEAIFLSPSAWAINCKKIINPEKKSGCGWASVKYNGKKLDIYKAMYHKKCQQQKDQLDQSEDEEEKIVEKRSTEFPKALKKETYQYGTIINRNTTHDYFSAVETVSFTSLGKMQPFLISLTSSSMLLMDFHCHLTTDEVVGYLGGFWDINSQTLSVTHVFPCLNSPLDRNKAGNVEYEIQKKMIQSDCTLVGWYHSHPQFNPQPTLRDIDNQLNYEMIMRGTSEATYSPCFGLIYGTYHEDDDFDNESKMLPFIVIPPHENRQHELSRPVMMNMDIKQDQTLPNGIKDQMIETFNYYKTLDYELVNFAEMKMNEDQMVIDKMKNSLYPKFPLEDQLNNNLWNWIRELIGLEQEENIAIPKKCLEKQRQREDEEIAKANKIKQELEEKEEKAKEIAREVARKLKEEEEEEATKQATLNAISTLQQQLSQPSGLNMTPSPISSAILLPGTVTTNSNNNNHQNNSPAAASSSPRDSPATIPSNAPSPAKFEIPVRASPSPAKSDASSNRTRNSPAPSPGKGHMPDRPTRNSSSISSSSSKYDYSSLAGMNPSHLSELYAATLASFASKLPPGLLPNDYTAMLQNSKMPDFGMSALNSLTASAAALAGTGSSNNYHSSPSGGNNKKSSSSYSNSQHHHQQQQQQQQQQQLQQLQQLQQQQQQHLQQPSTSGGSQNNNANNWLSQIPNMKEFMSQLEKSGDLNVLMQSPYNIPSCKPSQRQEKQQSSTSARTEYHMPENTGTTSSGKRKGRPPNNPAPPPVSHNNYNNDYEDYKSEAGKIADLMKSPEYTQMLMNQANAFRGLGTEITVTRKSGSNKKSSSSSSSHSGSNQNSGSNAQSSGGGSGGGGGNSGAGNSLLNQLPVMDLNYLAEISKSIPELNALLNSNKPEDINALLQMQMMAKSSMDYASQLFGTGGGPTSGSSSGNSNKNNSNSASAKAMQDYAQAAASSNMLSQYMSGMTGMGGGQNLSSLFGPMYGMGSMESPPPEHQKQSSSNSRKRDNSSRNSGNYQTALAAASAVPSSTTNVAPNAADLLNSLFTNSSKGNSFLGSHDLSAYFGGMPAASNNPHSHLTSSSKSSNNSSSGGGITSGLDYSALFSQMSPAKLQEMTSLFSQAKYPGIPDPLAKSTLAANNMYYGASLSPSLMKLQQEALNTRLMKPPKSSSSSSSSSKIDTPPPPPISASPHRSTPTKSSQRDSPAMPGKYNFSVADLSVSSHPLAATDFSRKSTPTPPSSTSQTPPIKKRMEFSSIAELVAPSPSKRQKYDDDDDDVPAVLNLSNN